MSLSYRCRIRDLREQGYCYVLECDIDSYFDTIDQDLLISRAQDLIQDEGILELIRLWVKAEIYDGQKVFTLAKGIPQTTYEPCRAFGRLRPSGIVTKLGWP